MSYCVFTCPFFETWFLAWACLLLSLSKKVPNCEKKVSVKKRYKSCLYRASPQFLKGEVVRVSYGANQLCHSLSCYMCQIFSYQVISKFFNLLRLCHFFLKIILLKVNWRWQRKESYKFLLKVFSRLRNVRLNQNTFTI